MNPYDKAAFGFSQAYAMNMRAADQQRRANAPSTDAFVEEVNDVRTDYNYSPDPQAPAPPDEQYTGMESGPEVDLESQDTNNAMMRARQKVSKYLRDRD